MEHSSRVKSLVMRLRQVQAQLVLIKHHPTLLAQFLQVFRINRKNNQARRQPKGTLKEINLTVTRVFVYVYLSTSVKSMYKL